MSGSNYFRTAIAKANRMAAAVVQIGLILCLSCAGTSAIASDQDLISPMGWNLQKYSRALLHASRSNNRTTRLIAICAIQDPMTVALIKEETALSVVRALSSDSSTEIRLETLNAATNGLARLRIIEPVLPLVKKMQSDPAREVANHARDAFKRLIDRERECRKKGWSKEKLRRDYYDIGFSPKLY